ncbi:hypothetical protein [Salibaculum halophilum]|uniref:hypothetical protein n=1 Tax=Salibaculum halophilum TaxID=1914408 RepID=UPI000A11B331|nr:hypothetical protein [Salibaculum halophilum]
MLGVMPRFIISVLGLILALAAGHAAVQEYRFFRVDTLPTAQQIQRAAQPGGRLAQTVSIRSIVAQMSFCVSAPQSLIFDLYPTDARRRFSQACQARAEHILDRNPTLSIAHLARAVSNHQIDDLQAAMRDLRRARASAPNEGWIARERVQLALTLAKVGAPEARDIARADILMMMSERPLRRSLAGIYSQAEDQQDFIVSVIDDAPNADQRAFLRAVRRRR